MPQNPRCLKCNFAANSSRVCMWGDGPQRTDILMIVGEAPDYEAIATGLPFSGRAGQLLSEILYKFNMSRDETYITYLVKCIPKLVNKKLKVNKTNVKACNMYLMEEVMKVQPKVTIAFGGEVLEAITGLVGIDSYHGRIINSTLFGKVVPINSLTGVFGGFTSRHIVERDIGLAIQVFKGDTNIQINEQRPPGIVISHKEEEIEAFFKTAQNYPCVVSDLETTGLNWNEDTFEVTHYGASYDGINGIVFDPREYPHQYSKYLQLSQVVFNAGYEGNIFPQCTSIIHDVQLLCWLANQFNKKFSLEHQLNYWLGGLPWKGKQHNWDDWAERNGIDISAQARLYHYLLKHKNITPRALDVESKYLVPAQILYAQLGKRGIYVDQAWRSELQKIIKDEIRGYQQRALLDFNCSANLNSPQQMEHFLFDVLRLPPFVINEDTGSRSTGKDTLAELEHLHPFISLFRAYRTASRNYSQFLKDDEDGALWANSKIFPYWMIVKIVTGRPQAYEPTVLNIPRDKRYRKLLKAPPGKVIVGADLSQIEPRMMAFLSRDMNMLSAFKDGGDIHTWTANNLLQYFGKQNYTQDEFSYYRSLAKPINLGYNYGSSAETARQYAKVAFGINWSASEAEDFRNFYFGTYPGVAKYHTMVRKFVYTHGYIESPLGTRWDLSYLVDSPQKSKQSEAGRAGINYPCQELGGKYMIVGALAAEEIQPGCVFFTYHDAVYCYIDIDKAYQFACQWEARWKEDVKILHPEFDVEFKIDIGIGPNLGELKGLTNYVGIA